LDRLQSTGVDLLIDLVLDIARQGAPAHNLHIVGKVASVMKLRCMAHRDVLRGNRVWLSCFYRMSRVDSISRNHPYTIKYLKGLDKSGHIEGLMGDSSDASFQRAFMDIPDLYAIKVLHTQ